MTIVYVDVLLVLNFVMNFVLLRAAALCAGQRFAARRGALSAAFGALSSLIIFVPLSGAVLSGLYKLAVCAVMVWIAYPLDGRRAFLRDVFCLFSVSFLFSGVMLALYLTHGPASMAVYNGVVYFDVNLFGLLAMTVVCYLAVSLLSALLHRRAPQRLLCRVTIEKDGRRCTIPALIDTGNNLREPFSGRPAMVCGAEELDGIFPLGVPDTGEEALKAGMRLIPFHAVGSGGVLPAFEPDLLLIVTEQGGCDASDSYVAISRESIGTEQYRAIVNPAMLTIDSKVGEAL